MTCARTTTLSRSGLAVILALLLISLTLRMPGIVQPIGIDQGIFATAAWGMSEGLRLYVDLWDQKPPGIHLAYRAAFAVLGPEPSTIFWLDLLAAVACCALMFAWGAAASSVKVGAVGATVFAVGSLPALRFGYGGFLERAVPETFITLFLTAAALAVTKAWRAHADRWLPIAGATIGAAIVMKPTALVYAVAFAGWYLLVAGLRATSPGAIAAAIAALFFPAVLVAAWLYARGSMYDAWVAVVEYNRAYVTAGGGVGALILELAHVTWRHVKTDPIWTAGFCAMAAAVAGSALSGRLMPLPTLCACWLLASAVAIAANGIRMFNSYFMPPVPALSMAVAWLFVEWPWKYRRPVAVAVTTLAIVVGVSRGAADRLVNATSADGARLLRRDAGEIQYLTRFGGYATGRGYSARANAELVEYIRSHTKPGDRIFIFGMAPSVYFMSQRLPAQRFLWAYPAVSDAVRRDTFTLDALVRSLEAADPVLLILERNNRDSLQGWRIETEFERPPMHQFRNRYSRTEQLEDFLIHSR